MALDLGYQVLVPDLSPPNLMHQIAKGTSPATKSELTNCPKDAAEIMQRCFADAHSRPSFEDIVKALCGDTDALAGLALPEMVEPEESRMMSVTESSEPSEADMMSVAIHETSAVV